MRRSGSVVALGFGVALGVGRGVEIGLFPISCATVTLSPAVKTVVVSSGAKVGAGLSTNGAVGASITESCGIKSSANEALNVSATSPPIAIAIVLVRAEWNIFASSLTQFDQYPFG